MAFKIFPASGDPLRAMKPMYAADLRRVGFFGQRTVTHPKQVLRQCATVNQPQDEPDESSHQTLRRNAMSREKIRSACRLIIRGRKDTGAYRTVLDFARQQSRHQIGEGQKDFVAQQRAKHRKTFAQGIW